MFQSTSFTMLRLINAVDILGCIIPTLLADHYFGAITVLIPIIFLVALCLYLWATVHSIATDLAWVVIFGIFGAGIQGIFPFSLVSLTKTLGKNGTRIAMVLSIVSIAYLTGPPLAGRLVQMSGDSYIGAYVGRTSLLVGGGILIAAKMSCVGRSLDDSVQEPYLGLFLRVSVYNLKWLLPECLSARSSC